MDYHPDGKQIVSASSSGVCKIWDEGTGKATQALEAHKGPCFWVRYSPDGTNIATCGMDKKVKLFDSRKASKALTEFKQKDVVRSCCFLENGTHIISSSLEGHFLLFDIKEDQVIHNEQILGDKTEMEGNVCYCITPLEKGTGFKFISAHEDMVVRQWEMQSYLENDLTYKDHTNTVRYVGVSGSGRRMVTACEDQSLRIWTMGDT